MKKVFLFSIFAIAALAINNCANAQATATAKVNLVLSDVLSIDPQDGTGTHTTTGDGIVTFTYPDAQSYVTDQNHAQPGHIKVTSTKAFDVVAKATTPNFAGASDNIDLDVLHINVTNAATVGGTPSEVILSAADQPLLTGATSGVKTIDVDYKISGTDAQNKILGKPAGTYTTTVLYTLTAQ